MSLGRDEVERIAMLARLEIREEDVDSYARNLSAILEFVEQMGAVPTEGIEPMAHPLDATQRLRHDQVSEAVDRAALQSVAPLVEDGLYLVPKVIE